MQPPIHLMPRDVPDNCACRWESIHHQGGMMRLAEIGKCAIHNPLVIPASRSRESACRCAWVPTGVGWAMQMVEVHPECVWHGGSVRLNPRHVAAWARPVN
jgi:hypothetical protein